MKNEKISSLRRVSVFVMLSCFSTYANSQDIQDFQDIQKPAAQEELRILTIKQDLEETTEEMAEGVHEILEGSWKLINGSEHILVGMQDIASAIQHFILKRFPNSKEALIEIPIQAVIEIALEDFAGLHMGEDPASRLLARDAAKLTTGIVKLIANTSIGHTDYAFDTLKFLGQTSKPMLKIAQFWFYKDVSASFTKEQQRAFERRINFSGDYISRVFELAAKHKQDIKNKDYVPVYLVEHFDVFWFLDAVPQIYAKIQAHTLLNYLCVDLFPVQRTVYRAIATMGNAALSALSQQVVVLDVRLSLANNQDILNHLGYNRPAVFLIAFTLKATAVFTTQLIFTYAFTAPIRSAMDFTDLAGNQLKTTLYEIFQAYGYDLQDSKEDKEEL